ncbi:MAG: hypothetical protein IAF38_03050 [Bacteroidia bacterium]|nr:hypothetical protein [Bacteroidia bacterium]
MKNMRASYFLLLTIFFFCFSANGQIAPVPKTDTIKWHNVITGSSTLNGKTIYEANGVSIDSVKYNLFQKEWKNNPLRKCRPCYLFELNENDRITKEGDFFINIPIGVYKEYFSNGKLKVSGKYKNVYPLTHSDFQMGVPCTGKCTVKDGEWKYYSDKGKLLKTEKYKDGKLLKK